MNPELKRNLLIEFSPQRLIAMPLILGLIFAAAWTAEGRPGVIFTAEVLFALLIFLWGTRKAAGAFDSEIARNTWDGQRLSALTAGQIFIGKLFGSTSFVLYGAILILAANVHANLGFPVLGQEPPESASAAPGSINSGKVLLLAVRNILVALLGLVVAMFAAVVLMSRSRSPKGISVTACQLFAIAVAVVFADSTGSFVVAGFFGRPLTTDFIAMTDWYGSSIPFFIFTTLSLLAFLLWAVVGTIRQLRGVLQFRGYRWAWAVFVLFVGAYLAGFDGLYWFAENPGNGTFVFLTVVWMTTVVATYLAVFAEPKSLQGYRSYITALRHLRLPGIFEHQPHWITSIILVVLVLVVNLAIGNSQTFVVRGSIHSEIVPMFGMAPRGDILKPVLIVATLFLVRDCLLVLALNFGRNQRRADLAALVYLAVLYVIVPLVLDGFNLDQTVLMSFFLPRIDGGLIAAAWPVGLQIAGLAVLMVARWRTVREPMAPVAA